MSLSGIFRNLGEFFSHDYDEDLGVSSEYFSSSLISSIVIHRQEPDLQEVSQVLEEEFDLSIEKALRREYDTDRFSDKERAMIGAYRNYAEDLIREVREELPLERSRVNHASFEGAEYEIEEDVVKNEQYLEEEGLL